jgi:predicted AlkP superfamily pyrophosphatase or phosphodiesterase
MIKTFLASLFLFIQAAAFSQANKISPDKKPVLVVGIVVDQMRNDFIYRYWDRYSEKGFKRLVREGFYFRNAHYNYIPTYTGPGHASIYTGATPRVHGIIGNEWYNRMNRHFAYCAYDSTVKPAGTGNNSGMMSPRQMLSTTIGDEMKMTDPKSKVFALALKDRSAVLPGGHTADGAFWLDDATGDFISSSFYAPDIPEWLKKFNGQHYPRALLEKGWSPLFPLNTYTASLADNNNYEAAPSKKATPEFPYDYKSFIDAGTYGILKATPFGNTYTKDVALECLKNEGLGQDGHTDLLCISFSSPDIIGHSYGPRAVEVEDTYLRLDRVIAEILDALDAAVGKNNYILFLTADHGGADVPAHLMDKGIPAGYIYEKNIAREVRTYMQNRYGDSMIVSAVINEQIYLDNKKLDEKRLEKNRMEDQLCAYLLTIPGIAETWPSRTLKHGSYSGNSTGALLQNGYNHRLSGDVCLTYLPGWMDNGPRGTTHGSGYNYDTHVPVIFFGAGVRKGSNLDYVTITQIAPTVCEMLQISQTDGTVARPLNDALK